MGSYQVPPRIYDLSNRGIISNGRSLLPKNQECVAVRLFFTQDSSRVLAQLGGGVNRIILCSIDSQDSGLSFPFLPSNSVTLTRDEKEIAHATESPIGVRVQSLADAVDEKFPDRDTLMLGHRGMIKIVTRGSAESIAVGDSTGALKIWESNAKPHLQNLYPANRSGGSTIHCVTADAAGETVISSGTSDGVVAVWRLAAGAVPSEFTAAAEFILCVAIDPRNSDRIVTAERTTGAIKMWNLSGEKTPIWERKAHKAFTSYVAFSPSGLLLATGGGDGIIKLWSPDGKEIKSKKLHSDKVSALVWSPNGRFLASVSSDKTLVISDAEMNDKPIQLEGHTSSIHCVDWSPEPQAGLIATGGGAEDGTIRLWSKSEQKCVAVLPGTGGRVYAVRFSPDGKLLAAGDVAGYIQLWDVEQRVQLARFSVHPGGVFSIHFGKDGKYLYTSGGDNRVNRFDLRYYNRHIAGNLMYQEELLKTKGTDSPILNHIRSWAGTILTPR